MWKSEFGNIVSKRDKLSDLKINQLKLEVQNTYEENEKISSNFQSTDDIYVINKAYLDEKLLGLNGHLSLSESYYNEFNLQYNKKFYFREL